MRRIGLVVNPIAGMGGRVGLKGTDDKVEKARELGAEPRAPDRAREMLQELADIAEDVELFVYGDEMGELQARAEGFDPIVVGKPSDDDGRTTSQDTRDATRALVERDVDCLVFVGGDGTAVDVVETLAELDADPPILGVPAGVKVYSGVFSVTPEAAAHILATFESTEQAEVSDIDEDAYREGSVRTELRGVAAVPVADQRQASKQTAGGTVEGLAERFIGEIRPGVTYVLGPGSTIGTVKEELGFDGSPLGVDVYRDGEVLVQDAAEADILEHLGEENVIVVTPIGGQGFIFGRGNQQISPAVISQSDVEVLASRRKLDDLGVLRVDTGDSELDEQLRGWQRVRVGRYETRLVEVV